MGSSREHAKRGGNKLTRFLAPFGRAVKTMQQTTTVRRRSGREKAIRRIQSFVAGATLAFGFILIQDLMFKDPYQERATAWAIAFLVALVYAGVIVSTDRNEKEPWQMLLVCFLWGTVVSGSIAFFLNTTWINLIEPELMARGYKMFSIAPYTEELTKGAILLILWYASDEFDNALDGIIYGALVGIGFAMA